MVRRLGFAIPLLAVLALMPTRAEASLSVFQTFVGNYGVSTDGFGSTSDSGVISAEIPAGATVVAAYLYSSTFNSSGAASGTLNGNVVNYNTALGVAAACCTLEAFRADVTSIVAAAYNGLGGVYNFNVTEGNGGNQDGEALVVVYSQALLPTTTIGILNGSTAASGDNTAINFSTALDPTAAGFFAEMRLGIGFSALGQSSQVTVNGTVITNNAGDNDDGQVANGALITVGGFNDPFSPFLPSYAADHERYNLVPQISSGDTSIKIHTQNPTNDDNIFLAVFRVLGEGGVNAPPPDATVPEPASMTLLGLGLGAAAVRRRFGKAKA